MKVISVCFPDHPLSVTFPFNLSLVDNKGRKKGTSEDPERYNVGNGKSDCKKKVPQYAGGSRFQNLVFRGRYCLKEKDIHSLPFQDRLIIRSGIWNVGLGGNG